MTRKDERVTPLGDTQGLGGRSSTASPPIIPTETQGDLDSKGAAIANRGDTTRQLATERRQRTHNSRTSSHDDNDNSDKRVNSTKKLLSEPEILEGAGRTLDETEYHHRDLRTVSAAAAATAVMPGPPPKQTPLHTAMYGFFKEEENNHPLQKPPSTALQRLPGLSDEDGSSSSPSALWSTNTLSSAMYASPARISLVAEHHAGRIGEASSAAPIADVVGPLSPSRTPRAMPSPPSSAADTPLPPTSGEVNDTPNPSEGAWVPSPTSISRGLVGDSPSSATTASEAASRTPSPTPRAAPSRFRTTEWSTPTPNTSGRGIETPLPTAKGNGESVALPPTARPTEPPSPQGAEARPTPSPARVSRVPAAWSGADEEVGSMAPTAGFRGHQPTLSGSSIFTSSPTVGGTPLAASSRRPFPSGDDGDGSVAAPTSLPASLTGPPVSVGVPIPSPTMGGGRGEDEEGEGEEGISSALQPSSSATSTPTPTGFHAGFPTNSPAERTRGISFTPAPSSSSSTATADGAGQEESEEQSETAYPSSLVFTAPPSTGGKRERSYAPTSFPHPSPANTASPTTSSMEETRGVASSPAPTPYPDPSTDTTSSDGYSPAPTSSPHPTEAYVTASPTASSIEETGGATFSSAPTSHPDPSPVITSPYPTEASVTASPTRDSNGESQDGVSSPAPTATSYPAQDSSLAPTTIPTAGNRGSLSSSTRTQYPGTIPDSTESPSSSPPVGDQGGDVSFAPSIPPELGSVFPSSSAPTLYPGPSRASTMSPTASSTGVGSQGGDVSSAPTTPPDVGSATPASSSPTLDPGQASTIFPTASSTGVRNQGGDVSSAPTTPPDVGSVLPASSAPTRYSGRASTMSPTASSTGGTQQEIFSPAPSPFTPSPTVGGRGGAGDQTWSTGSPTSSPTFQGRKKVVDQRWPTTAPTSVATAHAPTLPWLETGSPTTSHHAHGTEQTDRPFSAAYWPMTSSSSPTSAPTSPPSPSSSNDSGYASQGPRFSSAPTTADGQEDPHLLSFAPTLASSSPGNRGFEFNTASPTSSPSVSSTATASESGWSQIEQDQLTTGFPTTSPSTTSSKTAAPTFPVSTPRSDVEDGVSTPTPTRVSGSGGEETPPPSAALFLTLVPTAPSSSSGTPEQGERGLGSDNDGEGNETFSPSGAPTTAIASDGGLDRDEGDMPTAPTATPAPTHHNEELWSWWFQTGGQRGDRGHALVNGVGGNLWHATAGSAAEDIALCADAGEGWVAIAGYTTGSLYSDSTGGDDAFLVLLDPDTGDALGGWQFGGEGSERVYALGLDQDSGDVVVGGFTTSSLFATNDDAVSQYFVARLDMGKLLLSPGWLDLADEGSDVVVWGWQYSASPTDPEAIVSLRVNSGTGVVTALGTRGLPADWTPRDTDFVPEDDAELYSSVFSLGLETGDLFRSSTEEEGLAAAVAVDEDTDYSYVASFTRSADNYDRVVVYKVDVSSGNTMWSYQATSEGVFEGRALAIDTVGDSDGIVIVAGTTGGTSAHGSYGSTDAFVLILGADDGSEICYYQTGTSFADVVTGISVDSSSTAYSQVTLGGYTEGSLAGLNAGGADMFAIGVRLASLCPDVSSSTSSAAEIEAGHGAGGLVGSTPAPGEASFRSPSASIGFLMMMQLQFLATLSLVQSVHDSASFLSSFVENLRWVNLWLPMPSSLTPDSCEIADAQDLIDEGVFFGNTTLVLAILLGIFLIHVGAVSAVEAYWLAQRCMSPGGGLIRHRPNGSPASRTSGYADDLPSGTERNSNGDWSQPNNRAEWATSQEPMQQQGRAASIPRSHNGDEWSSINESVSPTTKSLKYGTAWSPAGRAGRTLTPPGPSSLVKRCSDKGGGSLPGSPTRDGYRYGRTDQLYPHQSAVSSVRSASPPSLPWDSPTRDFTGAPAACRVSRVTHRHELDISGSGYSNQDRRSGGGEPIVDLLGMASVLSASVDTAAGVAPEEVGAGTPSFQQRSAAVISDSGSTFGDAMVAYSSVGVSRDGLDGGGGGDGLRRRRGDNFAGDGNRSETPRLFESDMDAKPTDQDLDDHDGSDPILACRRRSRSMWLHFPHLELLFLFWAFEGAVAAQLSALKNAECAHVFWLALAALVGSPFRRLRQSSGPAR
ncbi:hypothetical protein Esi_0092_0020 [Ectocarpus siliculosus]|uniref:Uncharacterized protein n=1 Tax=Ectocarpus siliculosus TaxID=2880 RepID=D7G8U8_ECTSI|nr:hypothetical protein Esi_0092_0020 [Ectocarpus siliculosus]|eukprot:CBJ28116.1 hypothetical protein Esi_0092_0020 [Ectocarpus siliculosus]